MKKPDVKQNLVEFMDRVEEQVYRTLEGLGGKANVLSLQVSVASGEALRRLVQRRLIREVGCTVEIVPEAVRKTDGREETLTTNDRDQQERNLPKRVAKTYRDGRRQHYAPLTGFLPERTQQLAARIVHWIKVWGDQDAGGCPICEKRSLERGLHAQRFSEWKVAMDLLLEREAIATNGRQVTLVDIDCDRDLPDPFDTRGTKSARAEREARRRSRSKRPLSAWVKRRILERGGAIPEGR